MTAAANPPWGGTPPRGGYRQHHRAVGGAAPGLSRNRSGRSARPAVAQQGQTGLRDYGKVFCPRPARGLAASQGIDHDRGCIVLARPDQHVAGFTDSLTGPPWWISSPDSWSRFILRRRNDRHRGFAAQQPGGLTATTHQTLPAPGDCGCALPHRHITSPRPM